MTNVDPEFLLTGLDRLVEQANITLNLLRIARSDPKILSYANLFKQFNFLARPMAPQRTKVVAYVKSSVRNTWELNGEIGWCVDPAIQYYRCALCYFLKTRSTRVCDTVMFFPKSIIFPQVNLTDFLKQAASDIVNILSKPPSYNVPSLKAGDPVRNALFTLAI